MGLEPFWYLPSLAKTTYALIDLASSYGKQNTVMCLKKAKSSITRVDVDNWRSWKLLHIQVYMWNTETARNRGSESERERERERERESVIERERGGRRGRGVS
jgi:hypothetical protein